MTQFFTEDGAGTGRHGDPGWPVPGGPGEERRARRLRRGPAGVRRGQGASTLNKPETGHLDEGGRRAAPPPKEFRGQYGASRSATRSPSRRSARATHIKVTGTSKGKGFAGTVKRHNFGRGPVTHGSHNVRAPGSIGQSAWPARASGRASACPATWATRRVTQRGLGSSTCDPCGNLLLVSGSVPGATGCCSSCGRTADGRSRHRSCGGKGKIELQDAVSASSRRSPLLHEVVRAEQASRRQGTHATKTRGEVAGGAPSRCARRAPAAPARARPAPPHFAGGGVVFGQAAARTTRSR